MPNSSKSVYLFLADKDDGLSEDSEELLPTKLPRDSSPSHRAPKSSTMLWSTALNVIFLTAAILFFLETVRLQRNFEAEFISRVSSFSPATRVIDYYPRLVNFSSEESKIYQGKPTPEMNAAWDRLSEDIRPMQIPLDMLPQLTVQNEEDLVKFPEEHGGGVMASMSVTHHNHCLNLLRKSTYREYYKEDKFFILPAEELREHLDHCIEVLRQAISCASDVTVVTYKWKNGEIKANPNKVHQCRRFDDVLDWAYKHAVHIPLAHMIGNRTAVKYE